MWNWRFNYQKVGTMFDGKYTDWNYKKIKNIIEYYGHQYFFEKKILDLGCGHGDIGAAFYRLGSDVTLVDAREEHLKIAAKKFPGIKTQKVDLDREWVFGGTIFDIILSLGVGCHLKNFEAHLKQICRHAKEVILETSVCDSDDSHLIVSANENKAVYDWSYNGFSSKPTTANVERIFAECGFSFKRVDNPKFNSGKIIYNWKPLNNKECIPEKRRIWFAKNENVNVQLTAKPEVIKPSSPSPNPYIAETISPIKENFNTSSIVVPQSSITVSPVSEKIKIKTAVCISGFLRTFELCYDSIVKNILNKLDCDVFIHTWDVIGANLRHFDRKVSGLYTAGFHDKIHKMYAPKKMIVEPAINWELTPIMIKQIEHGRDPRGVLSMFYKIKACNDLKKEYEKENNFTYDCVIRLRADLTFQAPIPVDLGTNFNSLYIPRFGDFGGINDQLAYSGSQTMDKYCEMFDRIEEYLTLGVRINPEQLLKFHLVKNSLNIERVDWKYFIKRSDGSVQNNESFERQIGFIR